MINNRHARRSAARTRASAANASPAAPCSRILVIVLALVALAIQTLVVQNHVHHLQSAGNAQTVSQTTLLADEGADRSPNAQRHKNPDSEDPSKCPFCQKLGHSGQLVASTAALVSLRYFVTVNFIAFSKSAPALLTVRHTWQSRAPPQE